MMSLGRMLSLQDDVGTPGNAEARAEANAELDRVRAPVWMQEYAAWHRQHRNDRGARFLMYSCHDQMNGQRAGVCGGHGNRIKHICWTLRAAAASRRVLLVDWQSPERLEEYIGPVAVDWRPTAAERAIFSGASSHVYKFGWPDVRTAPPPPGTKYLRVTGGSPHEAPCYNCTGFQASFNSLYGFLFRPTAAFREHVHATRVRLFGGASAPYVSMHVRMGDSAEGSLLHPSPSPNPNPNPGPSLNPDPDPNPNPEPNPNPNPNPKQAACCTARATSCRRSSTGPTHTYTRMRPICIYICAPSAPHPPAPLCTQALHAGPGGAGHRMHQQRGER